MWILGLPYRAWLLLAFLAAWAISAINPLDYFDFVMEHLPTVALLAFVLWVERRRPLSNAACTLLFIFMMLHVLGAHYHYSQVPYDQWSQALFGASVSELLGAERNHYDRLVHLLFGVLMVQPMCELVERWLSDARLGPGRALIIATAFLTVISHVYELIELGVAMLASPERAETYNGQQGDMFDAQKDMLLALMGSIASALTIWMVSLTRRA